MNTLETMDLRSGPTYIIVNKKTRLVLDDPVCEEGTVNVNRLNENNTQKWMLSQGRDGLWILQNVRSGKFLCTGKPHTKDGDPVVTAYDDGRVCRWSIIPEDNISFWIFPSNSRCVVSLDTSIRAAVMPVVLKDNPGDPARAWTFMITV